MSVSIACYSTSEPNIPPPVFRCSGVQVFGPEYRERSELIPEYLSGWCSGVFFALLVFHVMARRCKQFRDTVHLRWMFRGVPEAVHPPLVEGRTDSHRRGGTDKYSGFTSRFLWSTVGFRDGPMYLPAPFAPRKQGLSRTNQPQSAHRGGLWANK